MVSDCRSRRSCALGAGCRVPPLTRSIHVVLARSVSRRLILDP